MSFKLTIPFLHPVFNLIGYYCLDEKTTPSLKYFMRSISYLLAGLLYLVVFYRSQIHKKSFTPKNFEGPSNAVLEVYLERQNNAKKSKIKKYISIFLLSLINMIPLIIKTFVPKTLTEKIYYEFETSTEVLFPIIFFVVFSKIFLSSKIYKHQKISLIMITFCTLILIIIDIIKIVEFKNININNLIITLLYYISLNGGLYSLYDVLIKIHFEVYFNNPYHLMLFIGLFSFILLIPLDLFIYFYNDEKLFGMCIIKVIKTIYD